MFEPIHGSAPKYKGMNVANPLATIWAGALLLDQIGESDGAAAVVTSIEHSIQSGIVTKDMGGNATTSAVGNWLAHDIRNGN
jgi:3-isopropylmalate dehydrogenase